ncbi:glutamate-tRNA ligase [Lentinula raphanica]|nr:glutamate-tRNA ligase [Lentinula raphanica]
MAGGTLTLSSKLSPFPYSALAIAAYTEQCEVTYDETATSVSLDLNGSKIDTEEEIVHALAKVGGLSEDSAKAASFFALAKTLRTATAVPEIITALDSLDDHLAWRTYVVGHDITSADWILWGALKSSGKITGLLKNGKHVHVSRWYSHLESLDSIQSALAGLTAAKANKARGTKVAAGFALGLEGAEMGKVVTRFPPEPSGYLHIGHAKAAMLNQYFAKMYQGKLIIRFDDTNPSKEKTEFEETILEDLELLEIRGDVVTHTSDYFDQLYDLAVKMIESGKAYADDTEREQMQLERREGIASAHRDDSVEDNLKHFAEMKTGSSEGLRWCIRAKMSVDNPNKALRDPVIYRCNPQPHHRTGDKWKIYPTYDFACPIVDSIEGVTHALRTNEYRDRNPQYSWMIDALGLRKVNIWDFSRLNFIYTLLSKRKLHEFVNNGQVRGWDDPRFPTVRGIRRRGLTVEALRQFMLLQGPSQAIVSLEWDTIWALNKKVIDPIAPRHWAIIEEKNVPVTINGGPTDVEVKSLPKHKKNPAVGEKNTVYSSKILVDQEDAKSFEDQEEITLMDWGNAIVRSKSVDATGTVTSIEMDLHLEGDFKKTKKKITWLSQPTAEHPLVPVTLLDHDYLITKKKLEENDSVKDFITPVTEFRQSALADANVSDLSKGDYLQFERNGYFIFDGVNKEDGRSEFIRIPDGKAANLASKATPQATSANTTDSPAASQLPVPDGATNPPDADKATKMYKVDKVYGTNIEMLDHGTNMYKMDSIYKV